VARSLLKRGFRVRAITRDTQKPEAQALAEGGAEVVRGDLNNRSSVDLALEGAYGVFSVQNFYEGGYEGEVRQGKTLADAAKAAGGRHVVYSSVGSAHRETGIPHFDSKGEIEEYKCQTDLPYTILRPVFLHAELGDDARPDSRRHLGSAARPRQTTSAGERRGHRRLRFHGFREPRRLTWV
jgi:uncharacterized protein YbjT (DUF2867 family)